MKVFKDQAKFENCFVFQNKQVQMIQTQYKNTKLGLLVLK